MTRHRWPNMLLALSTVLAALVAASVLTLGAATETIDEKLGDAIFSAQALLYLSSWAAFLLGIALTLRWRDRYPTQSIFGPLLFVAFLILHLAIPLLVVFHQS